MATTPTPAPSKLQKKTASRSQAIAPIHTKWRSLKIQWAFPGLQDLDDSTRFPMVTLDPPSKKHFDAKPYLTKQNFAPGVDLNHPAALSSDPSLRVDKTKPAYRETFVWNTLDLEARQSLQEDRDRVNATDKTSTKGVQERQAAQLKAFKVRMTQPAKPVVCTTVEQWIAVDVDVIEKLSTPPPIHVWAFLQPHRLDGRTEFLAKDHAAVPDDHPRSGWAEYQLNPSGWSFSTVWKDGQSSQIAVDGQDWTWIKLDQPQRGAVETYRYKLRMKVQNVQTAGDLQRKDSNLKAASEIESGCWLKVWVRDPLAGFRKSPQDDESDDVMQSMDSQAPRTAGMEPESGTIESGGGHYTIGCHGFLRERMLDSINWKSSYLDCEPVYVLLFNPGAMDDLLNLHQILKNQGPAAQRIAGSLASVSVVVLGLAYALRQLRDQWSAKGSSLSDATVPGGTKNLTKSRAEQLIKLLESMEVSTWLAAYALDGFQDALPNQALATASKKNNDLLVLLSTLYAEVLDFALVDGVKHYVEFVKDRVAKRQMVLQARLKLGPDPKDQAAQTQLRKQMETGKARLGLGLSKAAGNLTPDAISLSVPLLAGNHTTSLPEPFGAPLPIPGIPLLWRVDLNVSGSLAVKLTLTPPVEDGNDWALSFGLSGTGSASAALGIHALWSDSSVASALAPSGKKGDPQAEAEYAENAKALDELRQFAANAPPTDIQFDVIEKLRSLMKYASLDAMVDAGLNLDATVGFQMSWNPDKGTLSLGLAGDTAFTANLKANMAAHLKISLATLDYPLAGMDKLATASAHDLTVNLSGDVLGYGFPDDHPWKLEWGKGRFDTGIRKTDPTPTIVWGTASEFQLTYTDIQNPNVAFDLVRTKASKPFATVPKKSVTNSGDESEGTATVQLRISSTSNSFSDAVAAGAWSLTAQAKKGAISMDPTLLVGGRNFLQDLLKNGKIDFYLHGSYLGSNDRYSDPLTLQAPQLTSLDYSISDRFLAVNATLLNFQDNLLWARVAGGEWMQVRLTGSEVAGFHFSMALRNSGMEKNIVNLQLSLVPDEIGMLWPSDPSSTI